MVDSITKDVIEKKVKDILVNKFHVDSNTYDLEKISLLHPQIGLTPCTLLDLYFELENEFSITFDENDVLEKRFDFVNNIIEILYRKIAI